ncbi:hypothetical protein BB558_004721 [Smittium angustum]|uniref:Ubiquitin-like modifier-activating enzyme ATG7 n=1 Tax=Smittium angustum TaxID=133377 RepID=A0A2U1J2H6_SMIAN|nr:hypothetical protein BB558_004721 [Smittium angustum]
MKPLKFEPLQTTISPEFWTELVSHKLYDAKLDFTTLLIKGWYECGRWRLVDSGKNGGLEGTRKMAIQGRIQAEFLKKEQRADHLELSKDLIRLDMDQHDAGRKSMYGYLLNTNTIEEFKSLDRNKLIKEYAQKIMNFITSGEATQYPKLLTTFVITTFADLKGYKFYYWVAHPSIVQKADESISKDSPSGRVDTIDVASDPVPMIEIYSKEEMRMLCLQYKDFSKEYPEQSTVFCVGYSKQDNVEAKTNTGGWVIGKLGQYDEIKNNKQEVMIAFIDPCGQPNVPGWPMRNLIAYIRHCHPQKETKILSFRDEMAPIMETIESSDQNSKSIFQSLLYTLRTDIPVEKEIRSTGWERNSQGKLMPKMANLEASMDPIKLATSSLDLNLQLMKWRLAPDLDLKKISETKCLIVGAGTLGCNVGRVLLGWGVRNMTFIDNGTVSYSNPPRQPLFNFVDIGKPKAVAAAESMKAIFPGLNSKGVQLNIPMPSHVVSASNQSKVLGDVKKLESLVEEHDVMFLLTDSRESRWLPTLLGSIHKKLTICVALGFDSFVVMRHGISIDDNSKKVLGVIQQLGCYFCNDVVAPIDSMSNRTLDQQCTVTRPGLAPIAAANAVELVVSLLQHPLGALAYPEIKMGRNEESNLGSNVSSSESPDMHSVMEEYKSRKEEFLMNVFNNNVDSEEVKGIKEELLRNDAGEHDFNYLELLTGLSELQSKTNMMLEDEISFDVSDDEFCKLNLNHHSRMENNEILRPIKANGSVIPKSKELFLKLVKRPALDSNGMRYSVPVLQNKSTITGCTICGSSFSIFSKKINCMNCGQVVCKKCSSNKWYIPKFGYNEPVPTCDRCNKYISVFTMSKEELAQFSSKELRFFLQMYGLYKRSEHIEKNDLIQAIVDNAIIPNYGEVFYRLSSIPKPDLLQTANINSSNSSSIPSSSNYHNQNQGNPNIPSRNGLGNNSGNRAPNFSNSGKSQAQTAGTQNFRNQTQTTGTQNFTNTERNQSTGTQSTSGTSQKNVDRNSDELERIGTWVSEGINFLGTQIETVINNVTGSINEAAGASSSNNSQRNCDSGYESQRNPETFNQTRQETGSCNNQSQQETRQNSVRPNQEQENQPYVNNANSENPSSQEQQRTHLYNNNNNNDSRETNQTNGQQTNSGKNTNKKNLGSNTVPKLREIISENIEVNTLSNKVLKSILAKNLVDTSFVIERAELVKLVEKHVEITREEIKQIEEAEKSDAFENNNICKICLDNVLNSVLGCGHMMCLDCAVSIRTSESPACPFCRKNIKQIIRVYKS